MLKIISTIYLLFLFGLQNSSAQTFNNFIEGKIIDAETNEAIPNVNVYLSNTRWGSTTNSDGYFRIKNIYPASYQLVVSVLGFKTYMENIDLTVKSNLHLNIKLIPQEISLSEISVTEERPEEWLQNLALFKKLFLGKSRFANQCFIENEYHLDFSEVNKKLIASCNQPLIIVNNALGFRIKCVLVKFIYDRVESHLEYKITPWFEELQASDTETKEMWESNRKIAYNGSLEHFISVFADDSFMKEGFKVYRNTRPFDLNKINRAPVVSSKNYMSSAADSNLRSFRFPDYLEIDFAGTSNIEEYERTKIVSWIKLISYEDLIDENGVSVSNSPFLTFGYWSQLGLADMLPLYMNFKEEIIK